MSQKEPGGQEPAKGPAASGCPEQISEIGTDFGYRNGFQKPEQILETGTNFGKWETVFLPQNGADRDGRFHGLFADGAAEKAYFLRIRLFSPLKACSAGAPGRLLLRCTSWGVRCFAVCTWRGARAAAGLSAGSSGHASASRSYMPS